MKSAEIGEMFSAQIATKLTGYMLRRSWRLCVASAKRSGTALMRDGDVMSSGLAMDTTRRAPRRRRRAASSLSQIIEGDLDHARHERGGRRGPFASVYSHFCFGRT